jgi:hypothetical protein
LERPNTILKIINVLGDNGRYGHGERAASDKDEILCPLSGSILRAICDRPKSIRNRFRK